MLLPDVRNIINDAGFKAFFQALWNYVTTEYKNFQLLVALFEWFWDTTCTFHFPGIGEVMLTPYDFSVIIGLKLGCKRIEGHDSISPTEVKKFLVMNPPRVSDSNVTLMWLFSNIEKCKSVETGTRMFVFLFIGSLLCPNLWSTVSLHYLWSSRNINCIKYYDWGGMAYATLLHYDPAV